MLLFTHSDSLNSFHVTGYYSVSCQLIPHFFFFPTSSSLHSPPASNLTWCAERLPLTSISPFSNPTSLSSYLHFDLMFREDLPELLSPHSSASFHSPPISNMMMCREGLLYFSLSIPPPPFTLFFFQKLDDAYKGAIITLWLCCPFLNLSSLKSYRKLDNACKGASAVPSSTCLHSPS